jgi:hypothetical protein
MDDVALALALARGRMAIGAFAVTAPGLATRKFFGRAEADGVEPQLTRMLGGRDLALGLGTVIALDKGTAVRGWLEASAFADAGDCIAALIGRRQMTQTAFVGTLLTASFSAAACLFLGKRLDPAPDAHPGQPEAVVTGHHE